MYQIDPMRRAKKEFEIAKKNGYGEELNRILKTVEKDPFEPTPGQYFEALVGQLKGMYSRRLDYYNRFIYEVFPNTKGAVDDDGNLYEGIVRVYESWGHNYKK